MKVPAASVVGSSLTLASELGKSAKLPRIIEEISKTMVPIIRDASDMVGACAHYEIIEFARRAVSRPIPTELFGYPDAIRSLVGAAPDAVAIGRLVAATIDTRTGYRPADIRGYTLSIGERCRSSTGCTTRPEVTV